MELDPGARFASSFDAVRKDVDPVAFPRNRALFAERPQEVAGPAANVQDALAGEGEHVLLRKQRVERRGVSRLEKPVAGIPSAPLAMDRLFAVVRAIDPGDAVLFVLHDADSRS